MIEDQFLKRLRKKARKGLRGWPIATIAFYGPNLSQATKVTVGVVPSENAEVEELRDWKVDRGDIRANSGVAQEILEFIEKHRVLSVAMTDTIIGWPHQRRNRLRRRMVSSLPVLARPRSLYGGDGQLVFCESKSTSFKRPSANLVYFTVGTHQIDGSMPSDRFRSSSNSGPITAPQRSDASGHERPPAVHKKQRAFSPSGPP